MQLLSLIFLLAIVAGLTLAGLRLARRAWRKREPADPSERDRYIVRRVLVVFGVLFFAYWIALPVAVAIIATRGSGGETAVLDLGPQTKQVKLETADGLKLSASYVPSRNGAAVITYPSREWTAAESKMLAEAGFGVLAVDMRGYGGSDGERNAFGWGATPDVDAAAEFLSRQKSAKSIGGFGQSVGGELMIEAAAADQRLSAVVSEGAGERSYREMLIRGPAAALAIPQALVLSGSVALLTGDAPPPALDDLAEKISPRALMLINGEQGGGGEDLNTEYFAAAGDPKEIWTIEDGGHTTGLVDEPVEYPRRVIEFFRQHLLGQ